MQRELKFTPRRYSLVKSNGFFLKKKLWSKDSYELSGGRHEAKRNAKIGRWGWTDAGVLQLHSA